MRDGGVVAGDLVRLQKFLADAGVASRRSSEVLISEGRVSVNGKVVRELGTKIDPINTKVKVDGQHIQSKKTKTYIAFHKPRGVLSTMSDPEGRPCLGDYFPADSTRLFHAGRLDKESEGLIILTDDGEWAQRLIHPRFEKVKRYQLRLDRDLQGRDQRAIRNGVELEDGVVRAKELSVRGNEVVIGIIEGRNQILRRLFSSLGYEVEVLRRTAVGSLKLGELPSGRFRHLSSDETINI